MAHILKKPYTEIERADFILNFGCDLGLRIEETDIALYALQDNEIIENDKVIIDPDYEEKKKAEEEKEFNQQFFRTSLGYVRRTVTMKNGSTKDFLTDILPLLVVGVPVLVYSRELEQTRIQATEPFINECKQQLFKDFYGEE